MPRCSLEYLPCGFISCMVSCMGGLIKQGPLIISPNEVFGDIMVLSLSPPREHSLTHKIFNLSLSNFI